MSNQSMQIAKVIDLEVDKTSHDKVVGFNDKYHKYFFTDNEKRDKATFKSVTQYIGSLKPKFDLDTKSKKTAEKLGKSQEYVVNMWEENRNRAATDGTYIHAVLENLALHGMPITLDRWHPKLVGAFKFYEDFLKSGKYEIVGIEEVLYFYDEETGVYFAGQRDIKLREIATGKIISMDYKTNEMIRTQGFYSTELRGPEMMSGTFSRFEACDYNSYTVQLNIYDFFDKEDEKADEMYIVHITDTGYQLIKVDKLDIFFNKESKQIELREPEMELNLNRFVIIDSNDFKLKL